MDSENDGSDRILILKLQVDIGLTVLPARRL